MQTDRTPDAQPQPDELLRRDRAGRVPRRPPRAAASTSTDDPLLHARLFCYLDTQLTRLGGPNFAQIPINRPLAPVNDNHRDGFGQQAVHAGRTPYLPNARRRRLPVPRRRRRRRLRPRAAPGRRAPRSRERGPDDDYAPGDAVLEQHDRGRAGPHRRRVHVRARQGRRRRRSSIAWSRARRSIDTRARAPGSPYGPRARRRPDVEAPARPAASSRRRRWRWSPTTLSRSTGASSRSSPTTAATSPASARCRTRCSAPGVAVHVVATAQGRDRRRRRRGRRAHRRPVVPHRVLGRGRRRRRRRRQRRWPTIPAVDHLRAGARTATTRRSAAWGDGTDAARRRRHRDSTSPGVVIARPRRPRRSPRTCRRRAGGATATGSAPAPTRPATTQEA